MIKAIAALAMIVDHVGMVLFPQVMILRIIGRLSMPLFAYGIARGFLYSEKNGTTMRYGRNLFLFAVVSQIPFTVLSVWVNGSFSLNIGFTWLLSICLLKALTTEKNTFRLAGVCGLIFLIALAAPIDYGISGVLYPCVMHWFMFRTKKPQFAFVGTTILYAIYVLMGGGQIQVFSILAFPILIFIARRDNEIKLPRHFFYWFYPLHIAVLLGIKAVLF